MQHDIPSGWQDIDSAPKDGREVYLHMPSSSLRAFWCKDLKEWVLSRPMHMETARAPLAWRPTGTPLDAIALEQKEK